MMKKIYSFVAVVLFCVSFVSCHQRGSDVVDDGCAIVALIPDDGIRFDYDRKGLKYPVFDALLNDSVRVRALWNGSGTGIGLSDSLYGVLGDTEGRVAIGPFATRIMPFQEEGSSFSETMGNAAVRFGWEIFDGKIVEVSFGSRYIREITDTTELPKVTPIPILIDRANRLLIDPPVRVFIGNPSGNRFVEQPYVIDPGFAGGIDLGPFISKGGVDTLRTDSVRIGRSVFALSKVTFSEKRAAIGVDFLKDFTLVFDFKRRVLYLEPWGM